MEKQLTISPGTPQKTVVDYETLRLLGMQYIERLGSHWWTDYNAHDPGITILEALCYALTELGYRMNFGMEDLLAAKEGEAQPKDSIFTARQILTTNPINQVDYRKLLIDIDGVMNAWLIKVTEHKPPLYINCKEKKLDYKPTEHPVQIKGLWHAHVELERSDALGDLNASTVEYYVLDGALKGMQLQLVAHQRADITWKKFLHKTPETASVTSNRQLTNTRWQLVVKVTFVENDEREDQNFGIDIITPETIKQPNAKLKALLETVDEGTLMHRYLQKEMSTLEILERIELALDAHRNLCEDVVSIGLIGTEEIGFCADIHTRPNADLEEVEAKIVYALQHYLSPRVPFHSLADMLKSGIPSEEIFEGPPLKHGFIKTHELEASKLRSAVYTSDIINLLMDIDGVESVQNFVMSKYNSAGMLVKKAEKWELPITQNHKPEYAASKSKWLFFKENIPYLARKSEVRDILEVMHARAQDAKMLMGANDLLAPMGQYRELDKYFSIQNDMPRLYGIGDDGLPANATLARKNQSRQLQGYLQFFEQVLADFLRQVEQFKQYVSLDESVEETFFTKFLSHTPGAEHLYVDATELQNALPRMAEAEEDFITRRNRILNHLLARFQEDFSRYVMQLYKAGGEQIAGADLINDKIRFLKEYPAISRRRFTAINKRAVTHWPTAELSGLQHRVSRLLGMDIVQTSQLFSYYISIEEKGDPANNKWEVVWADKADDKKVFTSAKVIEGKEAALLSRQTTFSDFIKKRFSAKPAGESYRLLIGSLENGLQSKQLFNNEQAALDFAEELYKSLNTQGEGMHLIEHILLRPLQENQRLMDTCVPDNCAFCGDEDPYSFKLSVVIPYWPERFRSIAFRRYAERIIREECPAHVLPKICWAHPVAMQDLDKAWQHWLKIQTDIYTTTDEHATATTAVIEALEGVETVYPEAVLHDCEDDRDENPVMLDQTKLGTF